MTQKLHIGAGNEVLPGWINHDVAPLPGIDVVHDLEVFPWPFADNQFNELRMINVLEHLSNTVKTLEEIHRITAADAKVTIRVPYWNSRDMATDPTHKVAFSEYSFNYFDPGTRHGKERPYYSSARFRIAAKHYYTYFWWGFPRVQLAYRRVSKPRQQRRLEALARHFCGVIWVMEFDLVTLK
jgi:SAM-dependent methyltransferase